MYGLVNRAVESFVLASHGQEVCKEIKENAGVELEYFNTMHAYDDSVTYNLVGAASKVLDLDAALILKEFGKYWIVFAKKEGYKHYFTLGGGNFIQFLKNLDRMHSNIQKTYTELKPPSFKCEELNQGELILKYFSERKGLVPFVEGLILGLAVEFNVHVNVCYDGRNDEGGFEVFRIKFI